MSVKWILAAVAVLGIGAYVFMPRTEVVAQITNMPELSASAQAGEVAYNGTCAACHGVNLAGTDQGPTFLHRVYVPGHHGDMSFVLAVRQGARQHHWGFGDMPPQPHITDAEIADIVTYVREIQRANGIGA